ncbi:MAG: bifunctional oligoribonuclease/PAP phosphatase NrnA [Actinobacteria bacterium]|nr:MAG: bifunctional oligoribonuclease/PAP phosphatase NrnA [Actinomycetota bacterium]
MAHTENGYAEVIDVLRENSSFVISSHVNPDGDAVGSTLATALFLRQLGKTVCVRFPNGEPVPHPYEFLPGCEMVTTERDCPKHEVFVVLECPSLARLGDLEPVAAQAAAVINIDHHQDNDMFGTANLVERDASACATILYKLFEMMCARMSPEIAENLYVGIVTDTGRFQYSSTDPETFQIAANLLDLGVSPIHIFQQVYERQSVSGLKLLGIVLSRVCFDEEAGVAYTWVCDKDFQQAGATMDDTEDFVNYLRSIEKAEVAFILKENPDGEIRGSMRSKGSIDVAAVAKELGGGGHRNAAGFSVRGDFEEICARVVRACRKAVETS